MLNCYTNAKIVTPDGGGTTVQTAEADEMLTAAK